MSHFETNLEMKAKALGLTARVDEMSIQISCKLDPRFWIRIEPHVVPMLVTDFMPASASPDILVTGFKYGLFVSHAVDAQKFLFTNITPSLDQLPEKKAEIRNFVNALARISLKVVDKFDDVIIRGKSAVLVEFK